MKKLTPADKAIRLGTLALMLGLALPPACSDDDVAGPRQEVVDGTGNVPSGGKGGRGGTGGFQVFVDGLGSVGGRGGKGGGGGVRVQGDGAMRAIDGQVHMLDGSGWIEDAGTDDAGR